MKQISIKTDGFLSKWGFHDGDIFDDFLEDHGETCAMGYAHKFLERVLKELVIPKIKNKIEIVFIETIHNPVRAEKVDGKEVNWYRENPDITIDPEFIILTEDELVKLL